MTADALTKPMVAPPLMLLLSTGTVAYHNEPGHHLLFRRLPVRHELDEDDILTTDDDIIKGMMTLAMASRTSVSKVFLFAAFLTSRAQASREVSTGESSSSSSTSWDPLTMVLATIVIIVFMERVLFISGCAAWLWTRSSPASAAATTTTTTSSSTAATSSTLSRADAEVNTDHPARATTSTQAEYRTPRRSYPEAEASEQQLRHQVAELNSDVERLHRLLRERDGLLQAREAEVTSLKRRIQDHFTSCTCNKPIFMATYSKCWHAMRGCRQFKQNSAVREITPCSDCTYCTPKETLFPAMYVAQSSGH